MLEGLMKLHKIIWQLSSAGILLLTIFCLFFGCNQKDLSDDMKSIKDKLEQLEKRLAEYEQHKEVKELKTKFDEGKAALEEQLKKIEDKIPNSVTKGQYHTVSRGETLYSISRKYNVSVTELRSLNNLKQTQNLQADQKLLISNNSKR